MVGGSIAGGRPVGYQCPFPSRDGVSKLDELARPLTSPDVRPGRLHLGEEFFIGPTLARAKTKGRGSIQMAQR